MLPRIRAAILKIPRGKVSTYGAIARAAGLPGAPRQVVGALLRLHGWQQSSRFSQVEDQARERGTTWSRVSSHEGSTTPQYWQVLRSSKRMFLRARARV